MSYHLSFGIFFCLNPLFVEGLKNELRDLDNIGGEDPRIQEERPIKGKSLRNRGLSSKAHFLSISRSLLCGVFYSVQPTIGKCWQPDFL